MREKSTHIEVIEKVKDYAFSIGFSILNLSFSPIKGPEGNIEYLLHLKKHPQGTPISEISEISEETVAQVVKEAHGELD